jgi:hypothetical protein
MSYTSPTGRGITPLNLKSLEVNATKFPLLGQSRPQSGRGSDGAHFQGITSLNLGGLGRVRVIDRADWGPVGRLREAPPFTLKPVSSDSRSREPASRQYPTRKKCG